LKTQGQPNVLAGAEEEPSQLKDKEDKNQKKMRERRNFCLRRVHGEKEEKY